MPQLKLTLFGEFQTTLDGSIVQSFESDKVRALLIFLALEAEHAHARTRLATLLWSGYEEQSARGNLRQALYQLRQVIGDEDAKPPFLLITRQTIQFNPLAHYTLDVTTFRKSIEESSRHSHSSLDHCDACLVRLTQAAALYQGDLLAGFTVIDSDEFEEWRRIHQEQLHLQAVDLFHQLTSAYEARNDVAAVQRYARRLLQLEPWREETHRQLMRLFARQGQRAAALAQYQSCRQALQQAFGVEPEADTVHVYEQIYAGKFDKESEREKDKGESIASSPCLAEYTSESLPPRSSPLRDWNEMPAVDLFAGLGDEMAGAQEELSSRATPLVEVPIQPPATPHNLPAQPIPFVGRADELVALLTMLAQPDQRLLTLVGPGGMGKTRLALEVAQQIVNPSPLATLHVPDGIFFVPLASLSKSDGLVHAIASAIGFDLYGSDPQQTLFNLLHTRQMLLILDNFEHLLDGAGLVAEMIQRTPHLRIIVTSRARLNLHSETVYQVRPLGLSKAASLASAMDSDAVRLFVQRAERSNRAFAVNESNLSAVLHICQWVEGMPLGLEMAAAWSEWLSVNEIAKEIEKSSDFLAVDWLDAPARQRSMRAVFEWSWKLLNAREQQAFRALSIFRGGFTRQAAEQVADASLRIVVSLANKSFLTVTHVQGDAAPRYHIHELLRQFAAEELRSSSEVQTTAQRHSDYYLDFLTVREEQMVRHSSGAIAELQGEWDNIQQAWTWAAQQKNLSGLGRSVHTLAQYCYIAGVAAQAVQLFQLAAQSLQGEKEGSQPTQENAGERAHVLSSIYSLQAEALVMLSHYQEGEAFAQRGIVWGKASGNHHAEVLGHFTLAKILGTHGHYREAQQGMLQTIELLQHYQKVSGEAGKLLETELSTTLWLGHLAMMCDQFQEAKTRLRAGLHLSQSMTHKRAEVSFLLNLAGLLVHRFGDYAIAKDHYQNALRISTDLGFRWGEGSALLEFGELLRIQGEYRRALDSYARALTIFETIHHPFKAIYSEMSIGMLFFYVGEYERSQLIFTRLANRLETLPEDSTKPNLLLAFATRDYHLQHYEAALRSIDAGLRLLHQFGSITLRITYFTVAGHCQANLHQREAAATHYQQALVLCDRLEYSAPAAEAHAGLAMLAFEQGDHTTALHKVEQILVILQKFPYAGIDEPFFVYLTCHSILSALHDPRAKAILQTGKEVLQHYASHIDDESMRRSFLENVAIHAQLTCL